LMSRTAVIQSNTPSYLPHQGGGFSPLVTKDQATPTGRHLPLDGGGWEGVFLGAQVH